MKTTKLTITLITLLSGATLCLGQGSGFTYHGLLKEGGQPVSGPWNMRFTLWNAESNGSPAGGPLEMAAVPVTNSQFSVLLDFGAAPFSGDTRWLEVAVRPGNSTNDFVPLRPRQFVASTPYAIRAAVASSLASSPVQPLEFYAQGARVLRMELATNGLGSAPNFIGGSGLNSVAVGTIGATIGGGGPDPAAPNGRPQFIGNDFATICGGIGNCITGEVSTICGGWQNTVQYECEYSFIGGGYQNTMAYGADYGVIGGGEINYLEADWGVIGGGKQNAVQNDARFSSIGGGYQNTVQPKAYYDIIAGGAGNTIGGAGYFSAISGGFQNSVGAGANQTTIAGGSSNTIGSAAHASAIGGGTANTIQAGVKNATIPGGQGALASKQGQWALASGTFSSRGDAQSSAYVLRATTQNATRVKELSLDGDSSLQRLTVPSGSRWSFDALMVAGNAEGATAGFQIKGTIKNVAGVTALVGTPSLTPLGADTTASSWAPAVSASDVDAALIFSATGDATTIRWVVHVRTVELTF